MWQNLSVFSASSKLSQILYRRVYVATTAVPKFNFSNCSVYFLQNVHTGCGPHPASWWLAVKRQLRDADHSPPPSAVLSVRDSIPRLPQMRSWRLQRQLYLFPLK